MRPSSCFGFGDQAVRIERNKFGFMSFGTSLQLIPQPGTLALLFALLVAPH